MKAGNKLTSKELSQDSRADKSQQLKKETKNQQKDAQRQRGNLLRLRREVLYRFQGSDDKCETMGV